MTNKRGSTYEAPDMAAMMTRCARALVRRANDGDLEALSALRDVDRAVNDATVGAARALHYGQHAYSWSEIGRELGITRQAAQKRFGDDEVTTTCTECREAEPVEHGMCSTCLHDAYRSGWQPGGDTTVEQADAYLRSVGIDPNKIRLHVGRAS